MRRAWFWLRWATRDLRARWPQVVAIALIVAVGTGVSSGLGSMTAWRQVSYDESYTLLRAHDVRVALAEGSVVREGSLLAAVAGVDAITTAEERLVAPTQVDASRGGRTILVPGAVIGVDVSGGGPHVDAVGVTGGRSLDEVDITLPAVMLETHFADHYDLPASGEIGLAGDVRLPYVGTGYSPEYFMVMTEAGGMLAEANYAVVLAPLPVAQRLAGANGDVNDLVARLVPGSDRERARDEMVAALDAAFPGIAATVTTIDEDPAHAALYSDMRSDQRTMDAIALLIFGAAVFAAFNLTTRIVEAKRRELGVAMALGQPRWSIAMRPMLMGLEVAVLGVVFGVGVGLLVAAGLREVLVSILPMPVFDATFQAREFFQAAILGITLPMLATAWPVWRAVRVAPIDALRSGHLAAKGGGLSPLLRRLTARGRSMALMPLRNVLRAPRRTVLTAIGIGAAISATVGLVGVIDSYNATIDLGVREIRSGAADRLMVDLREVAPSTGVVRSIEDVPGVRAASPSLRVGGRLISPMGPEFEVLLDLMDLENEVWHPTITRAAPAGNLPGIVLAEEAASDLELVPGDVVTVRHPLRVTGQTTLRSIDEPMRIVGLHPYPIRTFAYLDASEADRFGLTGAANAALVAPSPGADVEALKRALFELPGVASTQAADATVTSLRDLMASFTDILRFLQSFVLLLALLIAFNAAAISVDERAREHATMFAFGVRPRRVLRGITVEALLVGMLGTVIGIGLGLLAVRWIMANSVEDAPEIGMVLSVAPATIALAVALGVLAVAVAPLFTFRRLQRMDVPSTLRVME